MRIEDLYTNPVMKRIYIWINNVDLLSPMSPGVGKEDSVWSDHDVLRNSRKNPLLTGTTIAGNYRHALSHAGVSGKEITDLFGSDKTASTSSMYQSRLWVYESEIFSGNGNADTDIRDGVALTPDKQAADKKKYDLEAVRTGSTFALRLELILRENDRDKNKGIFPEEATVRSLLYELYAGDILLGAKSKRGYGRFHAAKENTSIYICDFTKDEDALDKWIEFEWPEKENIPAAWTKLEDSHWLEEGSPAKILSAPEHHLCIQLKLASAVLIRSEDSEDLTIPDSESKTVKSHIRCGKTPVIPGTSWGGLFRSAMQSQLLEICGIEYAKCIDNKIRDVFGDAPESRSDKKANPAHASRISFYEGTLKSDSDDEGGFIFTTRPAINRFTGGVSAGALFSSIPWFRGSTTLEISYPKDDESIGDMILLALRDIDAGITALGGETGVGRGVFHVEEVLLDGQKIDIAGHKNTALAKEIQGWMKVGGEGNG